MSGVVRIASLLLLLLAALVVSACTDDREAANAYVKQLNAAQQEFNLNAGAIAREPATSVGEFRRALQQFEVPIKTFAAKLRTIDVPSSLRDEHEQIVTALADFAGQFNRAAATLRNPDQRSVADAQRLITTAASTTTTRIDAAAAAIDSKLRK